MESRLIREFSARDNGSFGSRQTGRQPTVSRLSPLQRRVHELERDDQSTALKSRLWWQAARCPTGTIIERI